MLALLLLAVTSAAPFQGPQSYFPSRPPNAVIYHVRGVLLGYDIGNRQGGFSIRTTGGSEQTFSVGHVVLNHGRRILCMSAPSPNFTPTKAFCEYWPAELQVGKTVVDVGYWIDRSRGNERVAITLEAARK